MRASGVALGVVLLLTLGGAPALAYRASTGSFADLVRGSAGVVVGRVSSVRYEGTPTHPLTIATIRRIESVAGDPPAEFELRIPGGPVPGNRIRFVLGAPTFAPGAEFVLVLRDLAERPALASILTGHFPVLRDPDGSNPRIPNDLGSRGITDPVARSPLREIPLGTLRSALRDAWTRSGGR